MWAIIGKDIYTGVGVVLSIHDNFDKPAHQVEGHATIEEAQKAVEKLNFIWKKPIPSANVLGITLLIGKN